MTIHTTLLKVTAGLILLSLSSLHAEKKSALDIVNKAFAYTSSLKTYAFSAKTSERETQEDGTFITYTYNTDVKVNRPNQIRIDTKSKYISRTSGVNNGTYTVIRRKDKTHSQMKVPKDIDKAIEALLHKYELKYVPLASLVYSDTSAHVKLHQGDYIGSETLENKACDHVRFTKSGREVDVWVTQSKTPKIIAYSIKDSSEQPFVHTKTTITWKENPNITSEDFDFHAPQESKEIPIVTESSEA